MDRQSAGAAFAAAPQPAGANIGDRDKPRMALDEGAGWACEEIRPALGHTMKSQALLRTLYRYGGCSTVERYTTTTVE